VKLVATVLAIGGANRTVLRLLPSERADRRIMIVVSMWIADKNEYKRVWSLRIHSQESGDMLTNPVVGAKYCRGLVKDLW